MTMRKIADTLDLITQAFCITLLICVLFFPFQTGEFIAHTVTMLWSGFLSNVEMDVIEVMCEW